MLLPAHRFSIKFRELNDIIYHRLNFSQVDPSIYFPITFFDIPSTPIHSFITLVYFHRSFRTLCSAARQACVHYTPFVSHCVPRESTVALDGRVCKRSRSTLPFPANLNPDRTTSKGFTERLPVIDGRWAPTRAVATWGRHRIPMQGHVSDGSSPRHVQCPGHETSCNDG